MSEWLYISKFEVCLLPWLPHISCSCVSNTKVNLTPGIFLFEACLCWSAVRVLRLCLVAVQWVYYTTGLSLSLSFAMVGACFHSQQRPPHPHTPWNYVTNLFYVHTYNTIFRNVHRSSYTYSLVYPVPDDPSCSCRKKFLELSSL